ncbi:MAG: hypothetical protein IJB73_06690 [Firmicutes bacterium]|nr:hypothetical protein [Bacillota bacterium]
MKFYPIVSGADESILAGEYKDGRKIGSVTLGDTCLFFKVKLKVNYIPYTDIHRAFRRVQLVQTKMCCGKGDLEIENIVLCDKDDAELVQIQLPGARAGVIMLEELTARGPHIQIGKPE